MSFDMAQFHQVFFEESFEGLENMEAGLLHLTPGALDVNEINTIFRAAHSIKGGAGTFGFMHVSDFTHVMETILDEMRDGKRDVTQSGIKLLLEATDCLKDMLTASRDDGDYDEQRAAQLNSQMQAILGAESSAAVLPAEGLGETPATSVSGWHIRFEPQAHLLRTGNDVLRMFRELAELGELHSEVCLDKLPPLVSADPEDLYLAWDLTLRGPCSEAQVREIFSWVEDDCKLDVTAMEAVSGLVGETAPASNVAAPAGAVHQMLVVTDRRKGERRRGERRQADRRSEGQKVTSIRVDTGKLDSLINLVGELVITQSMLGQFGQEENEDYSASHFERLRDGLAQLERNTRELQEAVMNVRMMPISFSFSRFPRLVHDLSAKLGKQVELKLSGENTELDKTVLEKIGDPLVHLVRNSLDHGLEAAEVRTGLGKDPTGVLHLNAFHEGGTIVIQVSDDGAGLNTEKILAKAREKGLLGDDEVPADDEIHQLVFAPGFSTAEQVSDVSGRGVGMDVVLRNIKDIGGRIDVESQRGVGSTFSIRLPLTLAILDGQLVRVGREIFIVPLVSIIESLQVRTAEIKRVGGRGEVIKLRDDYIPVLRLGDVFAVTGARACLEDGLLVVAEGDKQKIGIFVDELLGQQQVVIKSLEANFRRVDGISGATILGDGGVALILDIPTMIRLSRTGPITAKPTAEDAA